MLRLLIRGRPMIPAIPVPIQTNSSHFPDIRKFLPVVSLRFASLSSFL